MIKGVVVESNDHHKRSMEYGRLINLGHLLNTKKYVTKCISASDSILIKIPLHLIEGKVKSHVSSIFFLCKKKIKLGIRRSLSKRDY